MSTAHFLITDHTPREVVVACITALEKQGKTTVRSCTYMSDFCHFEIVTELTTDELNAIFRFFKAYISFTSLLGISEYMRGFANGYRVARTEVCTCETPDCRLSPGQKHVPISSSWKEGV